MDNNSLTHILSSTKVDAIDQHWVASVEIYNFALSYHSGKMNAEADALFHILKG